MNINVDINQREKDKGQEGNVLVTLVIITRASLTDNALLCRIQIIFNRKEVGIEGRKRFFAVILMKYFKPIKYIFSPKIAYFMSPLPDDIGVACGCDTSQV